MLRGQSAVRARQPRALEWGLTLYMDIPYATTIDPALAVTAMQS